MTPNSLKNFFKDFPSISHDFTLFSFHFLFFISSKENKRNKKKKQNEKRIQWLMRKISCEKEEEKKKLCIGKNNMKYEAVEAAESFSMR